MPSVYLRKPKAHRLRKKGRYISKTYPSKKIDEKEIREIWMEGEAGVKSFVYMISAMWCGGENDKGRGKGKSRSNSTHEEKTRKNLIFLRCEVNDEFNR
jgi:hypothetical protein